MKQKFERLVLLIGLVVFGSGIAGIPSSGIANYNMPMLYFSVLNMILGATIIVLFLPFTSSNVKGESE